MYVIREVSQSDWFQISDRPQSRQDNIRGFREMIADFSGLPLAMDKAAKLVGMDISINSANRRRAFAKDILSIEVEGPQRPELTLVDLPSDEAVAA